MCKTLHPKQYIVPGLFPIFIGLILILFDFYSDGEIFISCPNSLFGTKLNKNFDVC